MLNYKLQLGLLSVLLLFSACSKSETKTQVKNSNNMIVVDNGEDPPTLDPQLMQDTTSARVAYDLFEGLTSFNQKNQVIPGLAKSWDISKDGKTYTFYLRPSLKFSNGTPITAADVVFSFRRLADPNVGSPYNFLVFNLVNGKAVNDGKLALDKLGVNALNNNTIQIQLVNPDPAFLQICSMPNTAVVSKLNLQKYGEAWTKPENMMTDGAYKIKEWVIKGHLTLGKNPNYYAVKTVSVPFVKLLPIVEPSSAFNRYQAGEVDITFTLPIDQYQKIKQEYPREEHTSIQEALYFYDFNMKLAKFANNKPLRQALSMAVDRNLLVKEVLG